MKFSTSMPLYRRLTDLDTDTATKAGSVKSKVLTYISVLTILCALVAVLGVAPAMAAETVLHSFNPYPQGANPYANVCLGPGGKLYGTTGGGGVAGAGVLFNLDKKGRESVLHSFTGGADGGDPDASVICDSAGNIYGTTAGGGSAGAGVVFRMSGAGHESVLYSFTGGADGGSPYGSGVIQDLAGNLYGTTLFGGAFGAGVVFKLDKKGQETVLYSFTGGNDGGYPYGGVIQDSAGNLYGTTAHGGAPGCGNVYKLDPTGQESVLYTFTGGNDGCAPTAGVIMDSAGNRYGTAQYGGAAGAGVVFKLDTLGNETVLYNFTGGNDGGYPFAGVIMDSAGSLYGTTTYGGSVGGGVVYKVDTTGHEMVLYSFTGKADGAYPYAGVIMDSAGNLYGDASSYGTAGAGVLFKLDPSGHYTVLYSFPGVDGSNPQAGVIQDSAGNLFGTTNNGGPNNAGIVYKLDPTGNESVIYSFTGGADGGNPYGGVIQDPAGNLYGAAGGGGPAGAGLLYKLDSTGHQTVLYSFTGGGADGASPNGVIMDSAGNLYGTTTRGGSASVGVVFKVDPMGHETVLHTFMGGADGATPYAGVTRDSAGNLYGTTVSGGSVPNYGGVAYKLDPTGHYTVLHNFTYGADGGFPWGELILDSAGNLYGTTWSGGPPSGDYPGVVFKIDTVGNFSVLYTFTGFSDGGGPRSNLVFDSAGNLYGTTQYGGIGYCPYFGCGVLFELNPGGQQTVLYSFSGGSDGSEPGTGLIRDASGNLYGTTSGGGTAGAGVVYKVTTE